jgi:hypothetical protein
MSASAGGEFDRGWLSYDDRQLQQPSLILLGAYQPCTSARLRQYRQSVAGSLRVPTA